MVAQSNTFPLPDGKAGIGYNYPETALEISSHAQNENNPTLLFSTGAIPIGGSGTDRTVKAYIALLDESNRWRYMNNGAMNKDFLIKMWTNTNNMLFATHSGGFKFFTEGDIERMRLSYEGNLGIGTPPPAIPRDKIHVYEFDINSGLKLNTLYGPRGFFMNGYSYWDNLSATTVYKNFDGNLSSMRCSMDAIGISFMVDRSLMPESEIFSANSGYVFKGLRINSNGNIGVCNSNPQVRVDITSPPRPSPLTRVPALRVNNSSGTEKFKVFDDGFVACSELKVATPGSSDWPDYVFTKEYKLTPLCEVEDFINSNGHLPGIPSAKEVEENKGIEVGKLQTKLLEKIEELTLHVIQLQKELEVTKNKLQQKAGDK